MKHLFFNLFTVLTMAIALQSCNKDVVANPIKEDENALTISFCDDETRSKYASIIGSAKNTLKNADNSNTVAMYYKSNGNLFGRWNCNKTLTIYDVPTAAVDIYALGNTSFDWPNNVSGLSSKTLPINLEAVNNGTAYLPHQAIRVYDWAPNTNNNKIDVKTQGLYAEVHLHLRNRGNVQTFTINSAKVTKCSQSIAPYGSSETLDQTTCDIALNTDITQFNTPNTDSTVLFIPACCKCEVEIQATRNNVDGFTYTDKYTLRANSVSPTKYASIDLSPCNTSNPTTVLDNGVIEIIMVEDNRRVQFVDQTLTLDAVYNPAKDVYVHPYATDKSTNWNYTLRWEGNYKLYDKVKMTVDGTTYDLGQSGSINNISATGGNKKISFSTNSADFEEQDIQIIAEVGNYRDTLKVTNGTAGNALKDLITVYYGYADCKEGREVVYKVIIDSQKGIKKGVKAAYANISCRMDDDTEYDEGVCSLMALGFNWNKRNYSSVSYSMNSGAQYATLDVEEDWNQVPGYAAIGYYHVIEVCFIREDNTLIYATCPWGGSGFIRDVDFTSDELGYYD